MANAISKAQEPIIQSSANAPAPYGGFHQMPIAGKWRTGKSGEISMDTDPYNGDVLVRIPLANDQDVDEAFRFASESQVSWASTLPGERASIMRKSVEIMESRQAEIVEWLIRESGSTRIKANLEWEIARAIVLESASFPDRAAGSILPTDIPGKESRVYRQPVGVVGMISPWNFPLHLSLRSVAPALALGNAVVLKPASDTPVTGGLLIAKMFEEAGLPDGVLSVVVGAGRVIGDAFVLHPVPRVISFTGSTEVGRGVAEDAAKSPIIKRVALELGGNSPFVVLHDADVKLAVDAAVFGKFLHQGQICMAVNRFIVDARVHDEFVDRFVKRVRGLKYGDPKAPETAIGPIINQQQLKAIRGRIQKARSSGAREVVGGEPQGQVLPPHVFVDVTNEMPIAREEIFGPVAPIIKVKDYDRALQVANDTEHGLSSAVFTRDLERGLRFALGVQAGMTHVNDSPVNDIANSPFGGEKNSGIGRYNGEWAIEEFTTHHWVSVQHSPRQYPF
jgi:aldehyde dehydrogenase (NAD+)